MKRKIIIGILSLLTVLIFGYCTLYNSLVNPSPYYVVGNEKGKDELLQLSKAMGEQSSNPEVNFIIIQEIAKILHAQGELEILNLFLTTYVEKNSKDPFNGYYLLLTAQNYLESEAIPFAIHYFDRILKNYSDLRVRGQSIHYICLSNLIDLVDKPGNKVDYYKELLSNFSDDIEKGPAYYYLAKTYEELGEWDLSIQAYKNFLQHPDSKVPGYPDAVKQIKPIIDFYDFRNKNWTMESLDDLVNSVKYAIRNKDYRRLSRYRAKINFFAVSWEQVKTEANSDFLDKLNTFMKNRVRYSAELDIDSNLQEAYLKTWGWSYRIETWFLYFRRVNFPADPEIHGQWEWAGIYFGDKPFSRIESQ
jgi:tetratricopeptide (TPR) repeat protein